MDIPNGMDTFYDYDADGRMTKISHKDGATVKQSFAYEFDDGGEGVINVVGLNSL